MKDADIENHTNEIAKAWVKLQNAPSNSKAHEELFWSHAAVEQLIGKDPKKAFDLILRILRIDSSTKILANLSAGPLENLLVYHGNTVIDEIEAEASRSAIFRKLLGGVWKRSMADDVWNRVLFIADRRGWDGSSSN